MQSGFEQQAFTDLVEWNPSKHRGAGHTLDEVSGAALCRGSIVTLCHKNWLGGCDPSDSADNVKTLVDQGSVIVARLSTYQCAAPSDEVLPAQLSWLQECKARACKVQAWRLAQQITQVETGRFRTQVEVLSQVVTSW